MYIAITFYGEGWAMEHVWVLEACVMDSRKNKIF